MRVFFSAEDYSSTWATPQLHSTTCQAYHQVLHILSTPQTSPQKSTVFTKSCYQQWRSMHNLPSTMVTIMSVSNVWIGFISLSSQSVKTLKY
jgi:hypothetical protein